MTKKIGVVRFPGTNCDRDVYEAVQSVGLNPEWLWHLDQFEPLNYGALILPGGFSFGDYLRAGALAARSPVMNSVKAAAEKGVPVLGICNGFQILCETHLLPGALVKNNTLRFNDGWVDLILENQNQAFGSQLISQKTSVKLPIARGEGRFYASSDELRKIWDHEQVWFTYKDNPNGSLDSIAGVMNAKKNVVGLMPHPERALENWMGSTQGKLFFKSLEAFV